MKIFIFEFRNGFGFDLEATSAKPMTGLDADGNITNLLFDGLVLLLPFVIMCYGTVFTIEEDYE